MNYIIYLDTLSLHYSIGNLSYLHFEYIDSRKDIQSIPIILRNLGLKFQEQQCIRYSKNGNQSDYYNSILIRIIPQSKQSYIQIQKLTNYIQAATIGILDLLNMQMEHSHNLYLHTKWNSKCKQCLSLQFGILIE